MALIDSKKHKIKEVLNSVDVDDDQSEIKYENDTHTFYLQQGEYLIPSSGQTVLLQNSCGEFEQYIISNTGENLEEVNVPITCYSPDVFSNLSESFETEMIEGIDLEEQQNTNLIVENDGIKYILNEESEDQQPQYRFAILRDGKLHLQTLSVVDSKISPELNSLQEESDEVLQKQLAAFEKSISLDDLTTNAPVDLDKITGKNLITGQTVTLDRYLNKAQQSSNNSFFKAESKKHSLRNKQSGHDVQNIINKRIAVGKTSNGKKLYGKIIQIKPSDKMESSIEAKIKSIKEENLENSSKEPQVVIKKHLVTKENFNYTIGKTLSGLMSLETIQRKIRNKNLIVKLIEKEFDPKSDSVHKTVSYVYGCMALTNEDSKTEDGVWTFILYNDKTSNEENVSKAQEDFNVYNETAFLTIQTIVDKCGRKSTKVNLNEQQSETHCYICKKEFKSAFQIRKHLSNVHFLNTSVSSDSMLSRTRKDTNEKWYQCVKCSKSFGTAGSLKRHLTVHDPSLRPLECSVCVNRFTDLSSLRKHLLIHTGIRAYACDVCNRTFVNQGDLNFHRRIHDPVKQFSCAVCNREFSRYSNLMRHVEIHRGASALHRCDICGCSYSFVSSLTRHIVQKHIGQQ